MISDVVMSTGGPAISDCSSPELGTDTYLLFNNEVVGSEDKFSYDRSISTGQRELQLFLNSQALLQEVPETGQATNEIVYQIPTGDFFTKTTDVDVVKQSKLYFSSSTPINSNFNVVYNVVTGGIFAATGDFGSSLKSSILGEYDESVFADYDYFLNGQKVYSGVGIGVSSATEGTAFIPAFGVGTTYGGVVTTENKDKFKYTAYRKTVRTHSITGSDPDVFSDTGFIEGRNNFYINGMQELQKEYLELYSGVNIIKRGLSAVISGESMENLTVENILL